MNDIVHYSNNSEGLTWAENADKARCLAPAAGESCLDTRGACRGQKSGPAKGRRCCLNLSALRSQHVVSCALANLVPV